MPTSVYIDAVGNILPSVTQIIGEDLGWGTSHLMAWARRNPNYEEEQLVAGIIGTLAHEMVERDLLGLEQKPYSYFHENVILAAKRAFSAWLKWKATHEFKLIAVEQKLVSEKYKVGGTLDIVVDMNFMTTLVDLKTSRTVNLEHLIQISTYGQIWNELHPDNPIKKYCLLRLDKETEEYEFHVWTELDTEWKIFRHLLGIHYAKQNLKEQRCLQQMH